MKGWRKIQAGWYENERRDIVTRSHADMQWYASYACNRYTIDYLGPFRTMREAVESLEIKS